MKKTILAAIIMAASTTSCTPPDTSVTQDTNTILQTTQSIKLHVLADRTISFVRHYSHPDPQLFKPLCDKIGHAATLDFRYSCITDYSDIVSDRYFVPFVVTDTQQAESNPWLASEKTQAPPPTTKPSDWQAFVASVNTKLASPPSRASDVASAIHHALVGFQEDQGKATTCRKILFLCTDGIDSYRQLPTIPQDVEVITVGVLPDNNIEQALHTTNVKRFENMQAAIDYLLTQNF